MITSKEISYIGKCFKPHGIKGEISASIEVMNIEDLSCLIMDIDGIFVPFFMESYREKGLNTFLLKFEGIDSDEDVDLFSGKELYALNIELSDEVDENLSDMIYLDELNVYSIAIESNIIIGQVVNYDNSTENPLFIDNDLSDKELLIPIVEEFIIKIDKTNKILTMDLPIGLMDLN